MRLSKRQADALKTWCKDAVIQYAATMTLKEIGSAVTVKVLCKRGLVAKMDDGYKLTSSGVDELRRRGFFTRPPGAVRGRL